MRLLLLLLTLLLTGPALAQVPPQPEGNKIDQYDIKIAKHASLTYMMCGAYYNGLATILGEKDENDAREPKAIGHGFSQLLWFVFKYEGREIEANSIRVQMTDMSRRMGETMRVPGQLQFYEQSFGRMCPALTTVVGRFMRGSGQLWYDTLP